MITIYFYGNLRKKIDPNASMTEETKLEMPYVANETFNKLLKRLDIEEKEIGEVFINHQVLMEYDKIIPDNARIAIFANGMHLIDGGMFIKGHAFIKTKPKIKIDFY